MNDSDITFWPFADRKGIRVLNGIRRVKSEIITAMLLQKGENPAIPEMGFAPDLFSNLDKKDVNYFCYEMKREILKRVNEIEEINIYPDPTNFDENTFSVNIEFSTKEEGISSFSFIWSEYINLLQGGDASSFVQTLREYFS